MDAKGGDSDVVMEKTVSNVLSSSWEINEKEQALSSEDLAWVDSCLATESEVPEGHNWDVLRDGLLDALSSQSHPDEPSLILKDVNEKSDECDMEEMEEKKDKNGDGDGVRELNFENVFLPTYKEGVRVDGAIEEEDGLGFGFVLDEKEAELSVDDIFKVWELDYYTEESDFVVQLTKALKSAESKLPISTETPYEPSTTSVDDNVMASSKITKDESLDDLIAGIEDISLSQSR